MSNKLILSHALIHFFQGPVSRDDAIKKMASLLKNEGYVKDSFESAVLEREKIYPTGLPTQPFGIAIPHTDSEHVNRAAMAIGVLPEAVVFNEMGSLDSPIEVRIVSMLAIEDATKMVNILSELATVFQNQGLIRDIATARTAEDVLRLYHDSLGEVVEIVVTQ